MDTDLDDYDRLTRLVNTIDKILALWYNLIDVHKVAIANNSSTSTELSDEYKHKISSIISDIDSVVNSAYTDASILCDPYLTHVLHSIVFSDGSYETYWRDHALTIFMEYNSTMEIRLLALRDTATGKYSSLTMGTNNRDLTCALAYVSILYDNMIFRNNIQHLFENLFKEIKFVKSRVVFIDAEACIRNADAISRNVSGLLTYQKEMGTPVSLHSPSYSEDELDRLYSDTLKMKHIAERIDNNLCLQDALPESQLVDHLRDNSMCVNCVRGGSYDYSMNTPRQSKIKKWLKWLFHHEG